ncbi:MAG: hypothetical protein WD080_06700, partial [Egibacteraceae bacterium]
DGDVSDPSPNQGDQPTQEEMEAYLAQLREAEPAELVAQAYTMLGTGAEVKLGRPDARVLIDAMGALTEAVAGGVAEDLTTRMRNGVVQLQTAQVQAEREAGGEAPAPAAPGSPSSHAPGGTPPTASEPSRQPPGQSQGQKPADRLWIPGREPR